MRIAVSGAHALGKTTLVEELGARLPHHATVAEPYEVLEEQGHLFAHPPTVDEYLLQLKQSLALLRRRSPNVIFDRCPLDFLGYIYASRGSDQFDLDAWRAPIERAMRSLDLVVALHVDAAHDPDLLIEDAAFRLAVDDLLRDIVDGDEFDLCDGVEILSLSGHWDRRIEAVLSRVTSRDGS